METKADTTAAVTDTTKTADAGNADTTKTETPAPDKTTTDTTKATTDQTDGGKKETVPDKTEPVLFDPAKVTLPEGQTMDEELMKEFAPLAAELKLNHEGGQKLVDLYTKGLGSVVQKLEAYNKEQADAEVTKWKEETKADKEIGGARLEESLATAGKAVARFGTPALRELLDMTGLANHPEVVRFCLKAGKHISEDTLGGREEGGAGDKTDPASTMYDHPTSRPKPS